MKRIVRTGPVSLPPNADSYQHVEVAAPVVCLSAGSTVVVKTFCGVEIICKTLSARHVKSGVVYDVKPVGEPKIRDFQNAGVPITQSNSYDQFVAFDWQILRKSNS